MSEQIVPGADFQHERDFDGAIWGDVTNPAHHDPRNFRYLVYAINPDAAVVSAFLRTLDVRDGIVADKSWGDQSVSLYDRPEDLNERVSLSMSLIDSEHLATWGYAGLIVEAPTQNIITTAPQDDGSLNHNLDFLLLQTQEHTIVSGDDMLRQTLPDVYNEVVALAKRGTGELVLKGFFFKTTEDGEPYDERLASRMQAHAARLGLPIVAINEESPFTEDKVFFANEDDMAIQFGGYCFWFSASENGRQFYIEGPKSGSGHFAAPYEILGALDFAVGTGAVTVAQAAAVLRRYEAASKQHLTPQAVDFNWLRGYFNNEL